jgi:hypothetical protein
MRTGILIALVLLLIPIGVAYADKPFEYQDVGFFPNMLNPCTGGTFDLTIIYDFKVHSHKNNMIIYSDRTITTSDGGEGRGTDIAVLNKNVVKYVQNDIVTFPSGDKLHARVNYLVNPQSFPDIKYWVVDVSCVGK